MQNAEFIKPLKGHSGCGLNLYKQNDRLFLRKDSGNPAYNQRLKKQYIKQNKFELSGIKTPKIYNYGQENGLFYFDMEFLNGITLAEYMSNIKIKEINSLIGLLCKSLPIENSQILPNTDIVFKKKIKQISTKLRPSDKEALNAVNILENFDFSNVQAKGLPSDRPLSRFGKPAEPPSGSARRSGNRDANPIARGEVAPP